MAGRFERLPPVKAMQALEALDRLGSTTAVADEMVLTRSAVSHMLRRLETDLGFGLTEPDGRGVRLTARAARYVEQTRAAINIMIKAAADSEQSLSGGLKIVCPPGFATFWLADRIGAFARQYGDVELTIATSRALGDIRDDTADVQIAFGDEPALRGQAELLARVSLFPVCAPSALSDEQGLRLASDLSRFRLLHLVTHVDWQRWLEASGAQGVDARAGVICSDMPMVQMAAAAGQGVALGDSLTARAALNAGLLVRPFSLSIPSRWNYFMRVATDGPGAEAATAFADWVRGEMQQHAWP